MQTQEKENKMARFKFRAWAHASKTMFYPDSEAGWELHDGTLVELPNTTLMQATGLKDKNGKEIYEGDIIDYSYDSVGAGRIHNIAAVEWYGQRWQFNPPMPRNEHGWMTGKWLEQMEIIGNIYENPDLLK